MTVTAKLSIYTGGTSTQDTVELGQKFAPFDENTVRQDIYITHNAVVSPIFDCALYITTYSGLTYKGSNINSDLTYLLGLGDDGKGVRYSMRPNTPWTPGTKFTSGWGSFKNSLGDLANPITLEKYCVTPTQTENGTIPVGGSAHIQIGVSIPNPPGTTGWKAFSLAFAYSASS